jgi:hypothetical protein
MLLQQQFDARKNLPDLVAKAIAAHGQREIRFAHFQFAKEKTIKPVVIVLAGIYQQVFSMFVEQADDQAQPDDLRPRAQDGHDFQRSVS